MRSLFSCSAVVLVLAACGTGPGGPYADAHGPLRFGTAPFESAHGVKIQRVAFVGAAGARVDGFLAQTTKPGRHPAVLFLHGSGGSSRDFLVWAAEFAQAGGVGLTIQQPNDAVSFTPLVVNARRALDALQALPDVDSKRLGVLGFSLGAETAAILAGVDRRPKVFSLMSGRGGPEEVKYVRRAHARFFVEAGRLDQIIPRAQLRALIAAVPQPKRVRWFDAPHTLTLAAIRAQEAWLQSELDVTG